jgi:tetratricopeptide (TPR) repeat protein
LARCQELVKSIIEFSKDELIPEALRDRVKSLQSNLHRDGQEHRFYSRLVDARMPKPRPTEFSSGTTFTINDVSTETRSPRAASSLIAVDSRTSRFDQRPQLQAILNAFDEYGFRLGVDEPSLVANELQSFRPILENEAILSLWAASAIASAYGQRADWITSILGHIAADPWQTEFRAAVFDADRQKLVNMSQRPDTLEQPATFQLLLAKQLSRFGEYSAAEAFLRETQLRAPNDFWINYELAFLLDSEPNATEIQRIESLRFYTAALAIQTNAGSYLNLGTALYHRNELDAAIRAYRLAIRLQPDYAIAHSSVASALAKQEKFDEAIQAYERAIQCKPDYAEAFNNVGALLNKQQKYAEAIDVLQHAIQYRANYALAYDNLGFSYLNVGQFDKATEALNKAIAIDDQLSSAYGNLGHIRMLQGKNDEKTIELLEKAISTNPQNAEAHVNLGGVYGNRGLTEKAIESFDRAIEINPDLAEAHLSRGMALSRQMKFELAAMSFREALRVRPGYVVAHFNLGSVLANMHRHDEAIEAFGKAIELQDNIAEAHFRLGSLYSLKRDFEKAIPSLRNTIKFKPDHLEAHVHLGHALANQGKLPEAIAAFESAARIKRNPVVLLYLGTARNQVGDYAGAIEALEDCVKLTPNNIAALQQLARLLASCPHDDCRDGKRAVDLATKLCQLTGYSNSDALSALGIAHAENGDFEQAIKCIEDAMTHSIAIQQSEFQKLIALFKDRMPFRSPEAATAESM